MRKATYSPSGKIAREMSLLILLFISKPQVKYAPTLLYNVYDLINDYYSLLDFILISSYGCIMSRISGVIRIPQHRLATFTFATRIKSMSQNAGPSPEESEQVLRIPD